jgi:hypothetical protein
MRAHTPVVPSKKSQVVLSSFRLRAVILHTESLFKRPVDCSITIPVHDFGGVEN